MKVSLLRKRRWSLFRLSGDARSVIMIRAFCGFELIRFHLSPLAFFTQHYPTTSHEPNMPLPQPAMMQLWHSLVDTIRILPTIPSNKTEEEKKTLSDALEKLDMLMALRRGERSTPDPRATPSLVLPTSALPSPGSGGGVKRKRKGSFSLSPAPQTLDLSTVHSSSLLTPNSTSIRAGTPMSREATGKHRRELYADQLPLQPGRKVAFKLPAVKAKGDGDTSGSGGSGGDDWILATVKRCILQDKMRYEVQDVDDGK